MEDFNGLKEVTFYMTNGEICTHVTFINGIHIKRLSSAYLENIILKDDIIRIETDTFKSLLKPSCVSSIIYTE